MSGSEDYDERILGSGAFVEHLQQEPQTSAKTGSVSLEAAVFIGVSEGGTNVPCRLTLVVGMSNDRLETG